MAVGWLATISRNRARGVGVDWGSARGGVVDGRRTKKIRIAAQLRNGLICQNCTGGVECRDGLSEAEYAQIECPLCDGSADGCEHCVGGYFRLAICARRYVQDIVAAVNIATHASAGLLPCAGGLLDQSAWFLDLLTAINNEQNRIDSERLERM